MSKAKPVIRPEDKPIPMVKVRYPIPARVLEKFYRLFDKSHQGNVQRLRMWKFVAALYPKLDMTKATGTSRPGTSGPSTW